LSIPNFSFLGTKQLLNKSARTGGGRCWWRWRNCDGETATTPMGLAAPVDGDCVQNGAVPIDQQGKQKAIHGDPFREWLVDVATYSPV